MKKIFIFLIIISIIIGALWGLDKKGIIDLTGFKNQAKHTYRKIFPLIYKPIKKLVKKEAKKDLKDYDKDSARKLFENTLDLYKKGYFIKPQEGCNQLLSMRLPEHFKYKVNNLLRDCQDCDRLSKGILKKPKVEKQMDILFLKNGREYKGKVIKKTDSYVDFQMSLNNKSNIGRIFKWNEIDKIKNISAEDYERKITAEVKNKVNSTPVEKIADIYKIFKFCVRNDFCNLIPKIIQKYKKEDPEILKKLVEYRARNLYGKYMKCLAMKQNAKAQFYSSKIKEYFPDTKIYKEIENKEVYLAKKRDEKEKYIAKREAERRKKEYLAKQEELKRKKYLAKMEEEKRRKEYLTKKKEERKKEYSAKNNKNPLAFKLMKMGDEFYNKGFKHLKKSMPGMPESDKHLGIAKKHFKKAIECYQSFLNVDPNNKKIERKLQESSEYYQHCVKQSRLK